MTSSTMIELDSLMSTISRELPRNSVRLWMPLNSKKCSKELLPMAEKSLERISITSWPKKHSDSIASYLCMFCLFCISKSVNTFAKIQIYPFHILWLFSKLNFMLSCFEIFWVFFGNILNAKCKWKIDCFW